MTLEAKKFESNMVPSLYFVASVFEDVFPHNDDPIVISVNTIRQTVDHRSSTNVMYWETFLGLQVPLDQLRPYEGCLVGFTSNQVEVQGYADLQTTFSDKHTSMTILVRYMVVNALSSYNMLLGRPSLNRLKAIPSSYHMKVKLPSPKGKVIIMKVD